MVCVSPGHSISCIFIWSKDEGYAHRHMVTLDRRNVRLALYPRLEDTEVSILKYTSVTHVQSAKLATANSADFVQIRPFLCKFGRFCENSDDTREDVTSPSCGWHYPRRGRFSWYMDRQRRSLSVYSRSDGNMC